MRHQPLADQQLTQELGPARQATHHLGLVLLELQGLRRLIGHRLEDEAVSTDGLVFPTLAERALLFFDERSKRRVTADAFSLVSVDLLDLPEQGRGRHAVAGADGIPLGGEARFHLGDQARSELVAQPHVQLVGLAARLAFFGLLTPFRSRS